MEYSFGSRLKKAWNIFFNRGSPYPRLDYGPGYYRQPYRNYLSVNSEQTLLNSILTKIAVDAASVDMRHIRVDDNDRYLSDIDSGLNTCLTLSANLDQTGRAFRQDIVSTMLDKGVVVIAPVDTDINPEDGSYTIETMRVGTVTEWYPAHVKIKLYNDRTGKKQEVVVPKSTVAIIENPFYAVMNAPNSTLQRLIRKLRILDAIDEQAGSGKLDLIIQLPYVVKTQARREQAEIRRKLIEDQLSGSKYGIAYTDGTEHITQLNRPVENNMLAQIEYLTRMLFSQLGITQGTLDGTADETQMLNYDNRIIGIILAAIVDEMKRKFLTKTARSQRQSIAFFRDPFKLVPMNTIAEIADKMTRNEIMSSNEIRQAVGMKPSSDPKADELRNKNLSAPKEGQVETSVKEEKNQNA